MDTTNADDRTAQHRQPGQANGVAPERSEGLIEQSGQRYSPDSASEPPPVAHHASGSGARQEVLSAGEAGTSPRSAHRRYEELRGHFAEDFAVRREDAGGVWEQERTFSRAEPNYRAGFDAGIDLRHEGRTFEEIEPELRREYGTRVRDLDPAELVLPADEVTWPLLREEIRCGFDAARAK